MGNTARVEVEIDHNLRKQIMDCAVTMIEEEGYASLSIKKIALKLGVSVMQIQFFYKTTTQIIADMADTLYYQVMLNSITIAKDSRFRTSKDKIRELMLIFIKSFAREPEMTKAIMYSGVNEIFAAKNKDCFPCHSGMEQYSAILDEGIRRGEFTPLASGTTWMMLSALLGFVMTAIENRIYQTKSFSQTAELYVDMLLGGLSVR
ncbi:AcrR family transcriptional regulator [Lachnospiraceae bacterium PM6-15]|uniref:TetR/AcrR family transcriptional regulator n=1 Tax=Ohessyouella blattaphilus TaxID=2949333 RepID=UPI003E2EA562